MKNNLFAHNTMQEKADCVDPFRVIPSTGGLGRLCDVLGRNGYSTQPIAVSVDTSIYWIENCSEASFPISPLAKTAVVIQESSRNLVVSSLPISMLKCTTPASNAPIYVAGDDDVRTRLELMDSYLKDFSPSPESKPVSVVEFNLYEGARLAAALLSRWWGWNSLSNYQLVAQRRSFDVRRRIYSERFGSFADGHHVVHFAEGASGKRPWCRRQWWIDRWVIASHFLGWTPGYPSWKCFQSGTVDFWDSGNETEDGFTGNAIALLMNTIEFLVRILFILYRLCWRILSLTTECSHVRCENSVRDPFLVSFPSWGDLCPNGSMTNLPPKDLSSKSHTQHNNGDGAFQNHGSQTVEGQTRSFGDYQGLHVEWSIGGRHC